MNIQASDISVFDIFKIGVGPSSSHTTGPMTAARRFRAMLRDWLPTAGNCTLAIELYGSLAATGIGHRTGDAICAGLLDLDGAQTPVEQLWGACDRLIQDGGLVLGSQLVRFDPRQDLLWNPPARGLELKHPNTLRFVVRQDDRIILTVTARSVGGGFVEFDEPESDRATAAVATVQPSCPLADNRSAMPYVFDTAADLVSLCERHKLQVAQIAWQNELARGITESELSERLLRIWQVMNAAIEAGLHTEGILPGGLEVRRRAPRLFRQSQSERLPLDRHADLRTSAYAIAVAEQNAVGGRVVTAPTNGSAGVMPAVFRELLRERRLGSRDIQNGLLIAGVIGAIIKRGASISGAEVGCQGEIGAASAMAAAAATGILGGKAGHIEDAAEIAIEHHLGLTCDPIRGLVQIPCIERNAMGAIKALNAAAMALASDGSHLVSLDRALRVMKQTGLDMKDKYRETATGGLGVG